jgi:hypothetical protein
VTHWLDPVTQGEQGRPAYSLRRRGTARALIQMSHFKPQPRRRLRVAARWLLRYLEEVDDATIEEAAMVAACFAALAGDRHQDAALSLRAMAERAASRRRRRA